MNESSFSDISPDSIEKLRRLSQRCGNNPMLTQGAGGNTSWKSANHLIIKASGKRLARALDEEIFVAIDQLSLRKALDLQIEFDFNGERSGQLRGSIETPLHGVIPHKVVIHVHSVNTLALAIRKDGRELLEEKLADLPWAWVPYRKPGWPLTWQLKETLKSTPSIWVLQNHGLIVADDSAEGAESKLALVEDRLREPAAPLSVAPSNLLREFCNQSEKWRLSSSGAGHLLAFTNAGITTLSRGVICPDQAVFLGARISVVDTIAAIPAQDESIAVVVAGHGVLLRKSAGLGADDMLTCLGLLSQRVPLSAETNYLSSEQVDELLDWEAEKHRQALDITS